MCLAPARRITRRSQTRSAAADFGNRSKTSCIHPTNCEHLFPYAVRGRHLTQRTAHSACSGSRTVNFGFFQGRKRFPSRKGSFFLLPGSFTSAGGIHRVKKGNHPQLSGNVTSARGELPSPRGSFTLGSGIHPSPRRSVPSASGRLTSASGNHPSARQMHPFSQSPHLQVSKVLPLSQSPLLHVSQPSPSTAH
jgi:hypothetical protein